jgi:CheY-like chemotaxis protein
MKTVLLADDEFDLTGTLRAILEGEGYAAEVCSDGRETLDRLKANKPDLLLMDVMMPRVSGYEVLKVMKQTPGLDGIPVVLMSAAPLRVRSADFRADGFLLKPFTLDAVLKAVGGLIGTPDPAGG